MWKSPNYLYYEVKKLKQIKDKIKKRSAYYDQGREINPDTDLSNKERDSKLSKEAKEK